MTELLSQLWTEELQMAFTIILIGVAILYVLSIVWVIKDAYQRGTVWIIWAVVAIIPLFGVVAYCLLRPPLYQIDKDEQELEIALKQRDLMKYGECANCGYPVESDYVICPNCRQRLKNLCPTCNHALDPTWSVCPYCATPVGSIQQPARRMPGASAGMGQSFGGTQAPSQVSPLPSQQAPSAAGAPKAAPVAAKVSPLPPQQGAAATPARNAQH